MVREVEDKLGPVDLLINNAAVVSPLGAISEVDPEAWWRTQEINVRGPMLCARWCFRECWPAAAAALST